MTDLPGISAFSRRVVATIDSLDNALTQEDVTEAVNACDRLLDEAGDMRNRLAALMTNMGQSGGCPATYEAVMEREEEGDTGCPICGRPAEAHSGYDPVRLAVEAEEHERHFNGW